MADPVYVYGNRAFSADTAAEHHPRLRARLSRRVECPGLLRASLVYRVEDDRIDWLTTDLVEVHRLLKRHPDATVRVIPVDRLPISA